MQRKNPTGALSVSIKNFTTPHACHGDVEVLVPVVRLLKGPAVVEKMQSCNREFVQSNCNLRYATGMTLKHAQISIINIELAANRLDNLQ